jgi:hypothetical protein
MKYFANYYKEDEQDFTNECIDIFNTVISRIENEEYKKEALQKMEEAIKSNNQIELIEFLEELNDKIIVEKYT